MKRFLASVGNAKLLGKVNGEFRHIADVRTLTESTLNFTNTMEEVRAGEGAQLYGRFSHDSGMTVTMTDAMFDIQYVALQVGANIDGDPGVIANGMYMEPNTLKIDTNNKIKLTKKPTQLGTACNLDEYVVWVKKKGCKETEGWSAVIISSSDANNKEVDLSGMGYTAADDLCVEYFVNKPGNKAIQIKSNFIPAELVLLLTTKLFAGDANAPETGKPIGEITVKIPRFSLDGNFDLSMAMSAASTTNISGTALAVSDGTCGESGIYAEIVEVIYDTSVVENLRNILLDPDTAAAGVAPVVYGQYNNGVYSLIDEENIAVYHDNSFASAHDDLLDDSHDNYIVVYDIDAGLPTEGAIVKTPDVPAEEFEKKYEYTAADGKKAYYYVLVKMVLQDFDGVNF